MIMLSSKKTFEDCLSFIENDLGYKLFDSQKALLRQVYEGKHLYYSVNRYYNTHWLYEAMRRLKEEMDRDNGCLPARLYELDGYATDTVIYDELEKENDNDA